MNWPVIGANRETADLFDLEYPTPSIDIHVDGDFILDHGREVVTCPVDGKVAQGAGIGRSDQGFSVNTIGLKDLQSGSALTGIFWRK